MNRAVRIFIYLLGSFAIIIGLISFVQGLFVPMIAATPWVFMGALFFIGGIVIIGLAARTRKSNKGKVQGAWRVSN